MIEYLGPKSGAYGQGASGPRPFASMSHVIADDSAETLVSSIMASEVFFPVSACQSSQSLNYLPHLLSFNDNYQ